ncbi:hypothetical protein NLG97_g11352 [Lecanicillium saksenae]|uniref:Uncharacterized protein n=1 Tax=Lecanicillium saksenae TaxID=468837 RepID=A0ACC1QAQ2_9HYPO|nr:hypothetical protein NLG97_g11352 [Lecanicillium saksenae]
MPAARTGGCLVTVDEVLEASRERVAEHMQYYDPLNGEPPRTVVSDTALVFVEYQRDGTWKKGCADRSYGIETYTMLRSGRYIPEGERPSPEEVRVNDLDGEFEIVYGDDDGSG